MTINELHGMIPLLVLSGSVIMLLLMEAFYHRLLLSVVATSLVFVAAFISLYLDDASAAPPVASLLHIDGYARFYIGLFLSAALAVVLFSYDYLRDREGDTRAFCILLVLATTGASVLSASGNLVSFFLGLEILSVSLYALIAYLRGSPRCIEAGVKYLILAAVSSAFILFGIALLYAETGTMDFEGIAAAFNAGETGSLMLYSGTGLLIVGFGFKLGVVPFHMWTPDVYEGAPAPVTSFIATVSKGAVVAILFRLFFVMDVHRFGNLKLIFTAISIASMLIGNLLALMQDNIKRMLAYSSIAHFGYLLIAFISGGSFAVEAATFYIVSYIITTLAAFGVVAVLSGKSVDADSIDDYRGLFWRRPLIAAVFTLSLLSLAGIPLTAGLMAKYYVVLAGIRSDLWAPVAILVISSVISLYYYLRVIAVMSARPVSENLMKPSPPITLATGCALLILTILILCIGVNPQALINIIHAVI